ncbi:MFS family permease [Paenarthrobacter sp. 4246]
MRSHGNHAKRSALWLCLGAGFITLLDQSMFVLAVPAMSASLHADSGSVQWILASYSLAFGVALVPAGRLGDIVGRRTLFMRVSLFSGPPAWWVAWPRTHRLSSSPGSSKDSARGP